MLSTLTTSFGKLTKKIYSRIYIKALLPPLHHLCGFLSFPIKTKSYDDEVRFLIVSDPGCHQALLAPLAIVKRAEKTRPLQPVTLVAPCTATSVDPCSSESRLSKAFQRLVIEL